MNDRIHQYLDGELTLADLTPAEQAEARRLEAMIDDSLASLRDAAPPDSTRVVMDRIRAGTAATGSATGAEDPAGSHPAAGDVSLVRWFWTPRPVRVRPAWGLLAAAAITLLVVMPFGDGTGGPDPSSALPGEIADGPAAGMDAALPDASEAATVAIFVQFRLNSPGASDVRLAGSFTGWEPRHELREVEPGVWSVLVPLAPGIHDYAFIVDGDEWVPDPTAPRVDDGFGGENSRLALLLTNGGWGS